VTDGKSGRCATCAAARPTAKKKEASLATRPLDPEFVIAQSRQAALRSAVKRAQTESSPVPRVVQQIDTEPCAMPLPRCFALLLEHAQERPDGSFRISAPARTLAARARMKLAEAERMIVSIMEAEDVRLDPAGNALILQERFATRVADVQKYITRHAYARTESSVRTRVESDTEAKPTLCIVPSKPKGMRTPVVDAATLLIEHAVLVDNEQIVRGCLPLLQFHLTIGARTAREIMERFARTESVAQKDGWRVIAIRPDALRKERDDRPTKDGSAAQTGAGGAPSFLRLIRNGDDPLRTEQLLAELDRLPNATDRQIADIEQHLETLRAQRDDLSLIIQGIEERVEAMRAARSALSSIRTMESAAHRSLGECADIVGRLMDILHHAGKRS
jgi:hypothetical protein